MKRTPIQRRTPLRSKPKHQPDVQREPKPMALVPSRALHRAVMGGGTSGVPIQKQEPQQHAGYMNAVRDLGYCMRCKRSCRPQFCHRDMGKGVGMKTDCREGLPGCEECHWLVGTSGYFTKAERRAVELDLGRRTRQVILAAGAWPARLPKWEKEHHQ